jgi:hypothetical protein
VNRLNLLKIVIDTLPIATFLIAVLTFIITFANFYRNRAKIKVLQIDNSISYIIKPDFIDEKTPDVYWNEDYRVIVDVIITNKSALPISIIEFTLNDDLTFNSYSRFGNIYNVTIQPMLERDKNGVLFSIGKAEIKALEIENSYINPVADIPPYTSVRGHLFFHYHDPNKAKVGLNNLNIKTSRGSFSFPVEIYEFVESALELPSSIQKARNENF